MRKSVIASEGAGAATGLQRDFLDVAELASVEVTSEHPDYPIESVFTGSSGKGWRASGPGEQTIRLLFDSPATVKGVVLEFREEAAERTQEIRLRWQGEGSSEWHDLVRQQWNFSPSGSTTEREEWTASLQQVKALELQIRPDTTGGKGIASLERFAVR